MLCNWFEDLSYAVWAAYFCQVLFVALMTMHLCRLEGLLAKAHEGIPKGRSGGGTGWVVQIRS